jgi:hypothetical protein
MDRAGQAVAMARAGDDQGLGVLCMLDDNAPQGLASFEAPQGDTLEDGTQVSRGPGQEPRPDDPRRCVRVEPTAGNPLVSWATPKAEAVLEATEWLRGYRARNERQAHRGKRMLAHGALTLP